MIVSLGQWSPAQGWRFDRSDLLPDPHWLLYFGTEEILAAAGGPAAELLRLFPAALCTGCSTAGEIIGDRIADGSVVAAAIRFGAARVRAAARRLDGAAGSRSAGRELAEELLGPDLRHVLLLSDGLIVNGTQLAAGVRDCLAGTVPVTGGLAGDGPSFRRTLTGLNDGIHAGQVVAVGIYGRSIRTGCGSHGGWTSFGPHRLITRSAGNVLMELDGQPALQLYRNYLGPRAAGLPATGHLFPLELLPDATAAAGLVRSILAVNEAEQSLTFAGDLPQGSYVRLMKASHDAIVMGAARAAEQARIAGPAQGDRLAVLVSCVGRRLVLGQAAELELAAVQEGLEEPHAVIGFYSYGEICPLQGGPGCELHNQTMTVATFAELDRAS